MSSPEENESFGSGLCRKNIETLLAAVAQTQGFDDDEAVTSATERTGGNDNGGASTSAENQDMDDPQTVIGAPPEIDGDAMDDESYTVVLCLPAPPAEQQTTGSGGKRKRGRKEKGQAEEAVKPPPLKRQTRARKEEDVLAAPGVEQHLMATAQKWKTGRLAEPPPPSPQPPARAPAPVQPVPRVEQQMAASAERRKSGRLQKGDISAAAAPPPPNSLPPGPPPPPAPGPPPAPAPAFPPAPASAPPSAPPVPRVEQQIMARAEERKSGQQQKGAVPAAAAPPPNTLPPAPHPSLPAPRVEQQMTASAKKRKSGRQQKGDVAPPPPPNTLPPAPAPTSAPALPLAPAAAPPPAPPAPGVKQDLRVEQQTMTSAEKRRSGRQIVGAVTTAAAPPNPLPLAAAPSPPPAPAPSPPPAPAPATALAAPRVEQQMMPSSGKRKRGRQPKGAVAAPPLNPLPPPAKRAKPVEEEEDVCFICFDGGSLVLCDCKGCPKAYHPACIKRDEAFFSSDARWTCGWHICTLCLKTSHYKCYTCTYSLCKGCTKDADYVCVRGNRGFCSTCMKTIMLLENKDQANNESVKVDFDDITSWEYLFKVYWVSLKEKLSLTISELAQAKSPWKDVATVPRRRRLNNIDLNRRGRRVPNSSRSYEHFELNKSQQLQNSVNKYPSITEVSRIAKDMKTTNEGIAVGMFQNICIDKPIIDKGASRSCIGPVSENPSVEKEMNKRSIDEGTERGSKDLMQEKSPQINLDEYAAIDFHNISLIYLRRNLLETLIQDENFHDIVVGSFVRIRISSHDPEDFYRLVQVLGTGKGAEHVMLEVLNLDKKEAISIDAISDQEFSKDECEQLRHSISRGLGKLLTIGDVQKKAMVLQPARLNEPLEAEILQLNRLLAQASEEGQKKEFRECIEEIQLLKLEHQRNVCEVPEVNADPKMAPGYESEEDTRINNNSKPGIDTGSTHMQNKIDEKMDAGGSFRWEKCARASQVNISSSETGGSDQAMMKFGIETSTTRMQNRIDEKIDASGLFSLEKCASQVNISSSETGGSDQAMTKSGVETSTTTGSMGNLSPANIIETENLWHYRDPHGKIQGPFSMIHLRRWSMTGLFPPDMRIWTNHEEYDSVLLNNALNGQFHETTKLPDNMASLSQKFDAISDNRLVSCDTEVVRADQSSSSWPNLNVNGGTHEEKISSGTPEIQMTGGNNCENKQSQAGQSSQENLGSVLSSKNMESSSDFVGVAKLPNSSKPCGGIDLSRPPPTPETSMKDWEVQTDDNQQSVCSDAPMQSPGIFKLPSAAPDEWCGYYPPHGKASIEEWDSGLVSGSLPKPPKSLADADIDLANMLTLSSSSHPTSEITSWQASSNEKIEFDALGEDLVSDLLTQVMESQGGLPSPTSAIKFEKELIQDCNDGCFSSIEDFSRTRDPGKSEALSSSGEIQLPCQSQANTNAFDPFRSSCAQSSASSEGETNGPLFRAEGGSEFHPPPNTTQDMVGTTLALGTGSETVDPSWGTVQGNINLVTVQGNVNLVLGGPAQGIPNLGFTNPGTSWGNSNMNRSAPGGSLPWDNQRKVGGERYTSPRDWGYQSGEQGFGRGRPPWSRHPYGGAGGSGGGYARPKTQRVCKFYESGHCKKGAFCDYLHP